MRCMSSGISGVDDEFDELFFGWIGRSQFSFNVTEPVDFLTCAVDTCDVFFLCSSFHEGSVFLVIDVFVRIRNVDFLLVIFCVCSFKIVGR